MKKRKKRPVLGLFSVVIIAFILVIGGKMYMNDKNNEKIENQKDAAISLRTEYKDLEEVIFCHDDGKFSGTENDFGTWYIDAKVKISNEWYEITTGKDGGTYGGISKSFPEEKIEGITTIPTKIKYSNGKEEVLK